MHGFYKYANIYRLKSGVFNKHTYFHTQLVGALSLFGDIW